MVKAQSGERPQIIVKGAKFGSGKPKKEDAGTAGCDCCQTCDRKRDEKAGVSMSMYNLNYVFAEPDERDQKFSAIFGEIDPNYLPATTDLRPQWVEILDQLDLGSCVSNSVAYCVRYVTRNKTWVISLQVDCLSTTTVAPSLGILLMKTGLTIRDGYKSVTAHSVCSESNSPCVFPSLQFALP